jgi:predicted ATP-dependent protease
VQAVGGVNEEGGGRFRLCRERGLNGAHGVVVPRANLGDLMLEQALVSAAAQGLFHVHAVAGIDELMTLLTGAAGRRARCRGTLPRRAR